MTAVTAKKERLPSTRLAGKSAKINLRFYDVVAQREVLSRDYDEAADRGSRAIHKFLDEVIETLTGEKGIFSSHLAYVRKTRGGKAVFIADMDGGAERRITSEGILSLLPAWLPGGAGIVYTPAASFQSLRSGQTATETFSYTVADQAGLTSTASVTVTVVGPNDAPTDIRSVTRPADVLMRPAVRSRSRIAAADATARST